MCVFLFAGLSIYVVDLHHYVRNYRAKTLIVKEFEKTDNNLSVVLTCLTQPLTCCPFS